MKKKTSEIVSEYIFFSSLILNLMTFKFSIVIKNENIFLKSFFFFSFIVLIYFIFKKNRPKTIKRNPVTIGMFFSLIFLGVLISLVLFETKFLMERYKYPNLSPMFSLKTLNFQFISLHLLNEAFEEFVFRKCMYEFMLLRSIPFADGLTSIVFSFVHPYGSVVDYVTKILISLELNFVYRKFGSLIVTTIIHVVIDSLYFFLLLKNIIYSIDLMVIVFSIIFFLVIISLVNRKFNKLKTKFIPEERPQLFRNVILLLSFGVIFIFLGSILT